MATDINRIILVGRLIKAPELRYTQAGTPVANFSLANNREYTANGEKKKYSSFFNCIAWNKLGEIMVQYCKKGQRVAIEGRLQQRQWEDNTGAHRQSVEVIVDNFQFLTDKKADGDQPTEDRPAEPRPPIMEGEDVSGSAPNFEDALPGNIPF